MSDPDILISAPELICFARSILEAVNVPPDKADLVATSLVAANLRGVDSHGAMRIPSYLDQIRKGEFDPKAQPTLRELLPATFMLDCAKAASIDTGPAAFAQSSTKVAGMSGRSVGCALGSNSPLRIWSR